MPKTKAELRIQAKEWRSLLRRRDVLHVSRAIAEQLETAVKWSSVKNVHIYIAIEKNNEVNTMAFLNWLWVEHPYISTYTSWFDMGKKRMKDVEINSKTNLKPDSLGIPTLKGAQTSGVNQYDVIIVPCLMADIQGQRLGYGVGAYDRFLATQTSAKTIGLCYQFQFIEELPAEEHDISLGQILAA